MTRAMRVALLVSLLVTFGAAGRAPAVVVQLPNLVPQPPSDIDIALADDPRQGLALRFAVTTRNAGDWSLDLLGFPPRDTESAPARQCTLWAAPYLCSERVEVGDFVWHAAHGHWHFEDFALYELRSLTGAGEPDLSPEGLVAGGEKVTFCLADTEGPSGQPGALVGIYTAFCPGVIQGISFGWGDTYTKDLPGQQILLAGVDPGEYALVITIDPDDRLHETDEADNWSWTTVTVPELPKVKPGARPIPAREA